ncbi:MAG: class I SAM-dependent methyltransferase [Dermatophilaceae bacterium]
MTGDAGAPAPLDTTHLGALAPPGSLVDWRLAVAWRAASESDILGALPGTVEDVARRRGLDPGAARAVVHLIAVWGLVTVNGDGVVTAGPHVLTPAESAALAQHGVWIHRWSALTGERLRDRSAPVPDTLCRPTTGEGLRLLAAASARSIGPVVDACLAAVPSARTALDLGGGHGEHSLELARRGLAVTVQDLPEVVELARADGRLLEAGVGLHAQDAFDGVAAGPFDLVLCSTVTNMFDADAVVRLVRGARPAVAAGGALVVVSYLRDRSPVSAVFGVQMLVSTTGGDAHGSKDYRAWLTEAGYGEVTFHDLGTPALTVVVARPAP